MELSNREADFGSSTTVDPAPSVSVKLRSITVIVLMVHSIQSKSLKPQTCGKRSGCWRTTSIGGGGDAFRDHSQGNFTGASSLTMFARLTENPPAASPLRRR